MHKAVAWFQSYRSVMPQDTPLITPSRRSFIAGASAAVLAGLPSPAAALVQDRFQTLMRRVMGLTWVGTARSKDDSFQGGELVTALGMKFTLMDDWSYDGAMLEVLNYGGRRYSGKFRISGECWTIGNDAGVSIYRSELIESDPLPERFAWNTVRGDFRFYNDSSRAGHFTLQGIMTNSGNGAGSQVNLRDADD